MDYRNPQELLLRVFFLAMEKVKIHLSGQLQSIAKPVPRPPHLGSYFAALV